MRSFSTAVLFVCVVELSGVAVGEWIFTWPYNEDGSCSCTESVVGSYQNFTSEGDCLTAFAEEEIEYCGHDNTGITEEQCNSAVSIAEGYLNGECSSLCTAVVAGAQDIDHFLELCRFEFVIDFDDSVTVLPDSCFSNYVYGWSDFDATNTIQAQPLHVFPDVTSAASCQELCQQIDDCVYFSYRAIMDSTTTPTPGLYAFQNAPQTCVVYDKEYMDQVLAYQVSSSEVTGPAGYCNADELSMCRSQPWEVSQSSLFSDYNCLNCDCETRCAWLSASHITGPAFCTEGVKDLCQFQRPTWTSTLPPCEVITEAQTEAGTAETDTAVATEGEMTLATGGETSTEGLTAETDTETTQLIAKARLITEAEADETTIELSTEESTTAIELVRN